ELARLAGPECGELELAVELRRRHDRAVADDLAAVARADHVALARALTALRPADGLPLVDGAVPEDTVWRIRPADVEETAVPRVVRAGRDDAAAVVGVDVRLCGRNEARAERGALRAERQRAGDSGAVALTCPPGVDALEDH